MATTRYRDLMIDEIEVRGLDGKTKSCYLRSMELFIEFYDKPPAKLGVPDIKAYQLYLLREMKLAPNSINRHLTAIRFFYRHVLGRHWYADSLPRVRVPRTIPNILTEEEVALLINCVHRVMYKAIIMTLYSSGMRHAELRNLKREDIDAKRMVIHIRSGKGKRDREALLSPVTLKCLRTYWRLCRLKNCVDSDWLFIPTKNSYNGELKKKLSHTAVGYVLKTATKAAGIKKNVYPHLLRHSFAVHLLERGVNFRHIQFLLGHLDIRSTVKYSHVANIKRINVKSPLDELFEGVVNEDVL